jgi:hypothetical protein
LATPEEKGSGLWFQIFLVNKTWTIENEKSIKYCVGRNYWLSIVSKLGNFVTSWQHRRRGIIAVSGSKYF